MLTFALFMLNIFLTLFSTFHRNFVKLIYSNKSATKEKKLKIL